MKKVFLYKLIPPRPTFGMDMTHDERNIMLQHIQYWKEQIDKGIAVAFGPVLDPSGVYGVGIIQVDDEAETRPLAENDPAILSGLHTFEIYPMPNAIVKQ
ncbi:MAG TPA: YciI family protein [Parafilimonas sp.]|nr:YciI family protein [Parafilimonas sp.]